MKTQQQTKIIIIGGVITILVGVGSFFGGVEYQKRQLPNVNFRTANGMLINQNGQRGMNRTTTQIGSRPISGEIISVNDSGVTVKTTDDSSKLVIVSDETPINLATEGARADLKVGEMITVFGTESSEGTVTAQNISIGSQMFQNRTQPQP